MFKKIANWFFNGSYEDGSTADEHQNEIKTILTTNGRHVDKYGNVYHVLDGKFHRIGGPAYEAANGYRAWYFHDEFHRLDGPAIEHFPGDIDGDYYINGVEYSKEDYWKYIQKKKNLKKRLFRKGMNR